MTSPNAVTTQTPLTIPFSAETAYADIVHDNVIRPSRTWFVTSDRFAGFRRDLSRPSEQRSRETYERYIFLFVRSIVPKVVFWLVCNVSKCDSCRTCIDKHVSYTCVGYRVHGVSQPKFISDREIT